jgi:regulator of sigma E protease
MLLTILILIILLGVLVLVHEWGHFIVARKFGVRVEEFAFGFPPRLVSVTRRGTRYALNLIPIGGYVKIFGESGEDEQNPASFSSRPLFQRFAIIAAGVAMNVVLAWVLFSVGHGMGLPTVLDEGAAGAGAAVTIIGVAPGSPASQAGLMFGDVIEKLEMGDQKLEITQIGEVQTFIDQRRGQKIQLIVRRGRETVGLTATPRIRTPEGEGALGIAMARIGVVRSPWWRAPWDGLKTTASAALAITGALGRVVGDLFTRGELPADVSGPVGIFAFANESRRLGLTYLIELAGILSVNLALLNILPIPALDGGRVLFLFIEGLRGGIKVNQRLEQAVHTMGFAVLLLIMAAITYRDVVRIF